MRTYTHVGFPGDSNGKASICSATDPGSIPELGRSPGEGVAPHSSILAWEIPWTEEPGGLQSMGLQRVGHNWATNTFISRVCTHVCLCMVMSIMTLKDSNQYTAFDLTTNPFPWTTLFTILIVGVRKPPPPMGQTWPLPVKLYCSRASLVLFIVSSYFGRTAELSTDTGTHDS